MVVAGTRDRRRAAHHAEGSRQPGGRRGRERQWRHAVSHRCGKRGEAADALRHRRDGQRAAAVGHGVVVVRREAGRDVAGVRSDIQRSAGRVSGGAGASRSECACSGAKAAAHAARRAEGDHASGDDARRAALG